MSSARSAPSVERFTGYAGVGGELLPGSSILASGENLATLGESQNSLKCLTWSEYMGPV